ncbi:diaminobutyrate acetyltransferase [Rhodospirillaceae bacterium KN72]|uniref:L-2,4-diaminobutyric acid acetyltransferase n=1 Tax=Pacificispira spongiicola TaxID=2729598 RepID=A0A7Y0DXA5_9PROT|nr:diaminobutyrate acetyltransferase [Pacificispira spongiicola]NMM43275.1 diaminobutyrate acetyltransferase [Pacificispira spongiicola]
MPRDGLIEDVSVKPDTDIQFDKPSVDDGSDVWALVQDINALDDNSMYCNLLQCSHFADTCVVARHEGRLVGWMSGYRPPKSPNTLFVWQVAVHPSMRGKGVAGRMIRWVLERPWNKDVIRVQSTITRSNDASWALFRSVADRYDADLSYDAHFEKDRHFDGEAPTEYLVTIAPLQRAVIRQAA